MNSRGGLLLKVYLQVETKEGGNGWLSLHGALCLCPVLGNFSCFMALFEVTSFTAFNWQLPMFYGPVSRLSSSSVVLWAESLCPSRIHVLKSNPQHISIKRVRPLGADRPGEQSPCEQDQCPFERGLGSPSALPPESAGDTLSPQCISRIFSCLCLDCYPLPHGLPVSDPALSHCT
jgi:hypothetical protein